MYIKSTTYRSNHCITFYDGPVPSTDDSHMTILTVEHPKLLSCIPIMDVITDIEPYMLEPTCTLVYLHSSVPLNSEVMATFTFNHSDECRIYIPDEVFSVNSLCKCRRQDCDDRRRCSTRNSNLLRIHSHSKMLTTRDLTTVWTLSSNCSTNTRGRCESNTVSPPIHCFHSARLPRYKQHYLRYQTS